MTRSQIKIYGERNTGTNYFHKILAINFEINILTGTVPKNMDRVISKMPTPINELTRDAYFLFTINSNLGWKHREIDHFNKSRKNSTAKETKFITITKNPYSWLLSLYRRPYHNADMRKLTFQEFLQTEWKTVRRETARKKYINPIELWNCKNKSYLDLDGEFDVLHVKYEDLLNKPEDIIRNISSEFKLTLLNEGVSNYEKSTKDSDKNNSFYKDYYGNELWKKS